MSLKPKMLRVSRAGCAARIKLLSCKLKQAKLNQAKLDQTNLTFIVDENAKLVDANYKLHHRPNLENQLTDELSGRTRLSYSNNKILTVHAHTAKPATTGHAKFTNVPTENYEQQIYSMRNKIVSISTSLFVFSFHWHRTRDLLSRKQKNHVDSLQATEHQHIA